MALTKVIKPSVFLEIGTYLGVETLNIAANLPSSSMVYTLDFDKKSFNGANQDEHDVSLSRKHFAFKNKLAFMKTRYEYKIKCLYGDSNTYDFGRFEKGVEMVYIDGGHDLRTLRSDTENAFRLLSDSCLSCIAWHDYGNPNYPQVAEYLDGLAKEHEIFHVQETMIAFYLKNASKELLKKILTK